MLQFSEMNDDLVDSWDSSSNFEEDLDLFLVPEEVECAGDEAVDEFFHKKALKNMSRNV